MGNKKIFIRNVLFAFMAQGISLLLSILMSLIVPKILNVEQYAYWQLFIFYIGYVGFSHLGLTDGVYLKIGGKNYRDLEYSLYKSQLVLSLLFQIMVAVSLMAVVRHLQIEPRRLLVIAMALLYMLVFNAAGYFGYVFQAVNKTHTYSMSIIVDRAIFIVAVLAACLVADTNYLYFILFYILSKTIALGYCLWRGWDLVKAPFRLTKKVWHELWSNIFCGSKLLLANIASTLILGVGRIVVDSTWGLTAFGQISFSLSLTAFFLQFISQISMVLFPTLRQVDAHTQQKLYGIIRRALAYILPIAFVVYFPMKVILGIWLPAYQESLTYLAFLLPICTYDGKMQLLCNTYFKVLRKENWLLYCNVIASLLSVVLCTVGAYCFDSVLAVVLGMVVAIAFRSMVAEICLAKMMGAPIAAKLLGESLLVIAFLIGNTVFAGIRSWILFVILYGVYLYRGRGEIKMILAEAKK